MSQFKVGDRVKILKGGFSDQTGVVGSLTGDYVYPVRVKLDSPDDSGKALSLTYMESEIEMIEQKPKTKTVRKYASVFVEDDGSICNTVGLYTEEHLKQCDDLYFNGEKTYHIIPTIFEDVEVPVETETRWNFICKAFNGNYYVTVNKYCSLERAKGCSAGEAIQKIDDSAEAFEIE